MDSLFYILIAYLCGALPFSVWMGKLFLDRDVRQYGDGNPGATNVFRAGNKMVGLTALLLDIGKAAAPVGWCYNNVGVRGLPMFLIAMAPVIGHAYSPFLKFRGGKALATAFGVWIGLTLWKASLPGLIGALVGIVFLTPHGWAVILALAAILFTLVVWLPNPLFFSVWAAQCALLVWKHRTDLRQRPQLRPWVRKAFNNDS